MICLLTAQPLLVLKLDGPYPLTNAIFENIEIHDAGTNGIYLSSNLEGDATFSDVTISNSGREAILNYAPKLPFELKLGAGNHGW